LKYGEEEGEEDRICVWDISRVVDVIIDDGVYTHVQLSKEN
jgi:hypothetical protein